MGHSAGQQPATAAATGCSTGRGLICFSLCLHFQCNQLGEPRHNLILSVHTRACSLFPCSQVSAELSFSGRRHWNPWLGSAGFRGTCHHTHIKSQNVRGTKGHKQQEHSHASIPSMQFSFTALDLKAPWQGSFSHFTPSDYGCGCVCVTANTQWKPIFFRWEKPSELIFWKLSCDASQMLTLFCFAHILLEARKWGSCLLLLQACQAGTAGFHQLQPALR